MMTLPILNFLIVGTSLRFERESEKWEKKKNILKKKRGEGAH